MNLKLTYFLLCSMAFIASSCNNDPIDDQSCNRGAEVSFDVSNFSNISRSPVASSFNHFVVFGDMKSVSGDDAHTVLFNKTKVEYIDGDWKYDGTKYWINNSEHSFVAVSPETIFDNSQIFQYSDSKLSFDYSIPASGKVDDIIAATYRRLYLDNESVSASENRIILTFSHLMSLLNIAPAYSDNKKASDAYILFHKIDFSGIAAKAQFSICPAPRLSANSTNDMETEITERVSGAYSIDLPAPVKVENNATNINLFSKNDAIIAFPQAFASDSESEIILYYTTSEDSSMNQVCLPLKNLEWEAGKSYLYKFIIESSGVTIENCEINPWNVVEGEEISVD